MQPSFDSVEKFDVSRESFDKLVAYHRLLLKWQKAINLISPKTIQNAWQRHFIDSVQLLPYISDDIKIIADLGSGGGFAGLVIAVCRPDIQVHLVDSDMRKCQFLKTVSRESGLQNVTVHNDRVEAVLATIDVQLITARGFTALRGILDVSRESRVKNSDMRYILLKGANYSEELADARREFDFQCDAHPSVTESESAILSIFDVNNL